MNTAENEIINTDLSLVPVLAGIHAACFGKASWSEDQIRGSLMLDSTQGWAASLEGMIAGFLLIQKSGDDTEILTLAVHPTYQRKGIGECLLKGMLGNMPKNGKVFLEVADNNKAARTLYEKCGFKEINRRKGYYVRDSGTVDAIGYIYESI